MNKIIIIFAICIVCFSCNNDETEPEVDIGGNGRGNLEILDKSFSFYESYSYFQESWSPPPMAIGFYNRGINGPHRSNEFTISIGHYTAWQNLELPEGTYEDFSIYFNVYDGQVPIEGRANNAEVCELKMVVKKTGSNYDITITGKTMDSTRQNFKMTWEGEIFKSEESPDL